MTLPASSSCARTVERHLDDAVVLLDDAAHGPLSVDGKGHEQEDRAERRRRGFRRRLFFGLSGFVERAVVSSEEGGRWWRSARAGDVGDRGSLRIHLRAEDEAVLGQKQQDVDTFFPGLERSTSGRRCGDGAQLYVCAVEWFCGAFERCE